MKRFGTRMRMTLSLRDVKSCFESCSVLVLMVFSVQPLCPPCLYVVKPR